MLTTILIVLPLTLGTIVGSKLRQPLGMSIIRGLVVSQLLTLFTTHAVSLAPHRFRLRAKGPGRHDGRHPWAKMATVPVHTAPVSG